jgi:hypothetical protein
MGNWTASLVPSATTAPEFAPYWLFPKHAPIGENNLRVVAGLQNVEWLRVFVNFDLSLIA